MQCSIESHRHATAGIGAAFEGKVVGVELGDGTGVGVAVGAGGVGELLGSVAPIERGGATDVVGDACDVLATPLPTGLAAHAPTSEASAKVPTSPRTA